MVKQFTRTYRHTLKEAVPLFFILALTFFSAHSHAGFEAIVDRTEISIEETFSLQLIYTGDQQASQPRLDSLRVNFDILSTNQSSQVSATQSGVVERKVTWSFILAPKREGQLLIPPFTAGGETTRPVQMQVTAAKPVTNGLGNKEVILETHIKKDSAYVQEQIVVMYRLMVARPLAQTNIPTVDIPGVRIEELKQSEYTRTIGHTRYQVYDLSFAIFAEQSGEVTIPSFLWTIQTSDIPAANQFRGFSGRYKTHRVRTEEKTIAIKARPSTFPASAIWLPADNLTVSETWSQDVSEFKVGEPITRTITLKATGLIGEQLPPVFDNVDASDFKAYTDQPSIDSKKSSRTIEGTRIEGAALMPTRAGELTLPAIKVPWWDVKSDSLKIAEIPARTVTVAPAENANQTSGQTPNAVIPNTILPLPTQPVEPQVITKTVTPVYWPILTALFATLALILFILLLKTQRTLAKTPTKSTSRASSEPTRNEKQLLQQAIHACEQNDPTAARGSVLTWAQSVWGKQRIHCLADIARMSEYAADTHTLKEELNKLDAALYSNASSSESNADKTTWNGAGLITALKAVAEQKAQYNKRQPALKPLYP